MHDALKSWGHPGGARNAIILNSDGEPAIVAVREALARCHGGIATPQHPPPPPPQDNDDQDGKGDSDKGDNEDDDGGEASPRRQRRRR